MVNDDTVGVLVDYYHFITNGEDFGDIDECKNMLYHTHIASFTNGRVYPRQSDKDDYKAFVNYLRSIGYDGYISVEAMFNTDGVAEREQIKESTLAIKKVIEG